MAELAHALRVLHVEGRAPITAELIRKQYLKLALRLHPDRNHASNATEEFKALGEAYATALQAVAEGEATQREAQRTQDLLDLFLRAMQGEDVAEQLAALGVHRPPDRFGVGPCHVGALRGGCREPSAVAQKAWVRAPRPCSCRWTWRYPLSGGWGRRRRAEGVGAARMGRRAGSQWTWRRRSGRLLPRTG